MEVWTISNQKGGVGKTTTAVSLGGLLAASGKKVLLIDIDPQGSLTLYFKYDPDELECSLFQVFEAHEQSTSIDNSVPVNDILSYILDTSVDNLFLMPSSSLLATIERKSGTSQGLGLVLKNMLLQLQDVFDYVLIDSPPQLGILMVNALACCQRLIIPVQTEFLALKGLERMLRTVEMVMTSLHKSPEVGAKIIIMPTMFDRRTQASVQCLRHLRNTYASYVWPSMVPVDTQFRNASKAGMPPSLYSPNSHGVEAYLRFKKFLINLAPVSVAESCHAS